MAKRSLTRRRFLGVLGFGAVTSRNLFTGFSVFLLTIFQAACRKVNQIFNRIKIYRIDTSLGAIIIRSHLASLGDGPLHGDHALKQVEVELPAAALLQLGGPVAASTTQRLRVTNLTVVLSGDLEYVDDVIRPTTEFTLSFSAGAFFSDADEGYPLSLDFNEDDLVLRISNDGHLKLPSVRAEWPDFDVVLDAENIAGQVTVVSHAHFVLAPGDGLSVNNNPAGPGLGGRSLEVFEAAQRKARLLFSGTTKVASVTWFPGEARTVLAASPDRFTIAVEDRGASSRADFRYNSLTLSVFDPAVLAFESLETVIHRTAENPGLLPAMSVEVGIAGADGNDCFLLPPVLVANHTRKPLRFTFGTRDRSCTATQIAFLGFSCVKGKALLWTITQKFHSLMLEVGGLAAGDLSDLALTLKQTGTAKETVYPTITIDSDRHGAFSCNGPQDAFEPYWAVGDYLVAPSKMADQGIRFAWQGNAIGSLAAQFELSKITWAGELSREKGGDEGWVHLRRKDNGAFIDPAKSNLDHRGSDYNFSTVGDPVLAWKYDPSNGSTLSIESRDPEKRQAEFSATANTTAEYPLLTALDEKDLRAAVAPAFPSPPSQTLYLPPFTLREHPDDTWIDKKQPGFEAQISWEPRTTAAILERVHDVRSFFHRALDPARKPVVQFVNAGLRMTAKLLPFTEAAWAPKPALPAPVPYRPLLVQSIGATEAEDLVKPSETTLRACITDPKQGLNDPVRNAAIVAALAAPQTAVAISPIGGSIDMDWNMGANQVGLVALGLHSYLARYQNNYAIQDHLLLPWGLRIEVITRLFRNSDGNMQYCQRWRFLQDQQFYGTSVTTTDATTEAPVAGAADSKSESKDIRIFNLRPLNATTWVDGKAFLFQADIALRDNEHEIVKKDITLQGDWCHQGSNFARSATVAFDDMPDADRPRTLFKDNVILLKHVTWSTDCKADPTGTKCASEQEDVTVTVSAVGEVAHSAGMQLDTRAAQINLIRQIAPDTGMWKGQGTVTPVFQAKAATMGPGLLRVLPAADGHVFDPKQFIKTKTDITAHYQLERDVSLDQVQILQLLPIDNKKRPDALQNTKGKLTLTYDYASHASTGAPGGSTASEDVDFEGVLSFPDLTALADPICTGDLKLGELKLAAQPKSFKAQFGIKNNKSTQSIVLVSDVGVPGMMRITNTEFRVEGGSGVSVKFGSFELCPGLLEKILDALMKVLQDLLGDDSPFSIFFENGGLGLHWHLELPSIPLGGGSIDTLAFQMRGGFRFDFGGGRGRGFFFTLHLGKLPSVGFDGIDWPHLHMTPIGEAIIARTERMTFTFTPFTVDFACVFGFRAQAGQDPHFKADGFMCLRADGGLALAFDIGIVRGSVSLTLGLVWCPSYEDGQFHCLTQLGMAITVDAHACVIEIINVRVTAELIATFDLSCKPPKDMLVHMAFHGKGSISIGFVTISKEFDVDLDKILNLHPCAEADPYCKVSTALPGPARGANDDLLLAHVDKCVSTFFTSMECAA